MMMENIHSETYSLLIDTYIKDKSRKTMLLNAIDTLFIEIIGSFFLKDFILNFFIIAILLFNNFYFFTIICIYFRVFCY